MVPCQNFTSSGDSTRWSFPPFPNGPTFRLLSLHTHHHCLWQIDFWTYGADFQSEGGSRPCLCHSTFGGTQRINLQNRNLVPRLCLLRTWEKIVLMHVLQQLLRSEKEKVKMIMFGGSLCPCMSYSSFYPLESRSIYNRIVSTRGSVSYSVLGNNHQRIENKSVKSW